MNHTTDPHRKDLPTSHEPWRGAILVGDVRQRLAELPNGSIDCVITSPPYYGLRDYGMPSQLGLEPSVLGWVAELRAVMRQLARVLKPSGVLWLNLGDGYARHPREGALPKSLLLGPERLALSLIGDGWRLRNKVIWAKTNPLPTSVRDRLSTTYEVIYCFVRSRRYFFDLDAIRLPHRSAGRTRSAGRAKVYLPESALARVHGVVRTNPDGGLQALKARGGTGHPLGKNPGDVWPLATAGYRGAHFATFPVALVERPLVASCPARVCRACGRPWVRPVPRSRNHLTIAGEPQPACECRAGWRPGVALDPFMGAGTVAVAAERHGRDWVGIELNPTYAAMAEERVGQERAARTVAYRPTRTEAVRPYDPRAG